MAFFQRNVCYKPYPETSFTPFFHIINDNDTNTYSRRRHHQQVVKPQRQQLRRPAYSQWQPKFDVRETADAYELYGELPGVNKENVNIEFADPQTIVIRGKFERNYTSSSSSSATPATSTESQDDTTTKSGEEEQTKHSYQASVEDEIDSMSLESAPATPTTETEDFVTVENTSTPTEKTPVPQTATQQQQPTENAKYWLTERRVGDFVRGFKFATYVLHESVTASFKDGIITVIVPKAKDKARRITVTNN